MKSTYLVLLVLLVTGLVAGCITSSISSLLPSVSASSLALQPSDLPGRYTVGPHTDLTQIRDSWVKSEYLGGYYTEFIPMDGGRNITGISQTIVHFQAKNVSALYDATKEDLQILAGRTTGRNISHLQNPAIGDRSEAYRITDSSGNWDPVDYVIIFSKHDVIEQIEIYGSNPDYLVMKNIAEKASKEIP